MRIKLIISLFLAILTTANCQVSQAQDKQNNNPEPINKGKIDVLNDSAYQILNSDPARSLELSQLALDLSRKDAYAEGQINALLLTGMVYKKIGAFDKSAEANFTALRIAEAEKNHAKISSCLNNIGNIYQAQQNFEKALHYYQLSLNIEEDLNNKPQISIRLYNIGALYESADSLDRALTYYYNSLMIEEQIRNNEGILFALYGIAGVETRLGRYESAYGNLSRALELARKINDQSGLALVYQEFGKLYIAKKEFANAVSVIDSAIFYAKKTQMKNELMTLYLDLSNTFHGLGKDEKAYEYLLFHVNLKDTISGIEIKGKIAELETRFEVEKKQEEIQNLTSLNEVKTAMAESEKRNRTFLLITIVMIIILSVFNLQRVAPDTRSIVLISFASLVCLILIAFLFSLFHLPLSWETFFRHLRDVIMYSVPFLFTGVFVAERILMKKYLQRAAEYTRQLNETRPAENEATVTLRFEGKDAVLSMAVRDILCIEGADNYIAVYYLMNSAVKKELFRSTMKMAEEQLSGIEELVRCHKSYIINTTNVNQVSGNAQGYRLHIKGLEFSIPVSRAFPKSLIDKLRKSA